MHIALYLLLAALARNVAPQWSPLWPQSVPPDAFEAANASRIALYLPDSGAALTYGGKAARSARSWVFFDNGHLYQVTQTGRGWTLADLSPAPASPDATEETAPATQAPGAKKAEKASAGTASDAKTDAKTSTTISIRKTGPQTYSVQDGSDYSVVLHTNGELVTETWYDDNNQAVSAYSYILNDAGQIYQQHFLTAPATDKDKDKNAAKDSKTDAKPEDSQEALPPSELTFFYDNMGRITAVKSPTEEQDIVYDGAGHPLKKTVTLNPAADTGTADTSNNKKSVTTYEYTWDKRGRLNRLLVNGNEYSYTYTDDARGNWVSRYASPWARQGGWLFPQAGAEIKRKITY